MKTQGTSHLEQGVSKLQQAEQMVEVLKADAQRQRTELKVKEIKNGRLAMIAITAYVAEEVAFGVPVIQFTPDLFQPLIFANDFRAFMDGAFGMASMDGSVNGVAF